MWDLTEDSKNKQVNFILNDYFFRNRIVIVAQRLILLHSIIGVYIFQGVRWMGSHQSIVGRGISGGA